MTLDADSIHVVVGASESDDGLVLRISGELDRESRRTIEPTIMTAIEAADFVVLDLADLTFCDSSGVAMFCAVCGKAIDAQTQLSFRNVVGIVRTVFAISGVSAIFDLIEA